MSLQLLDRLQAVYQADSWLTAQGRLVRARVLVDAGQQAAIISIIDGRVTAVADAQALVMPAWTFALRASAEEWEQFWEPRPRPGHHDLFALLRRRQLLIEGDVYPFMCNLLYFKGLLALPRTALPRAAQ